ncbi:glycosyltransferase [Humibacter sp. RRB41]|uniref:glycosyltransferase n=1 Tax=Humibacter sp. RRB41 TaxID=2919946 RepID=UPI001FA9FF20|nr:glycosyltransferase [Humibacter sp. RRB41]
MTPVTPPHSISVVVPVYRGAETLPALVAEIQSLVDGFRTPHGRAARVAEVLLVHDHGPDASASVIRELEQLHSFVRGIWLSRNFGQHAATLAGIASSGEEWISTIDEDGQYDPGQIGIMLDVAMEEQASLVYAHPVNEAPHSFFRNVTSRTSKRIVDVLSGGKGARVYHSFRLMLGETGRSVAAYAGQGVYLDVALGWVADDISTAPIRLREEFDRPSGYNLRRLLSHFWRLVLTSGTRGLRVVSVVGAILAALGLVTAIVLAVNRVAGGSWPQGWASLMVAVLVIGGIVLFFLGIIAEYVGVVVNQAMGRPPYLIISDPDRGPLGRDSQTTAFTPEGKDFPK